MQRPSDGYRHTTGADAYDERILKTFDENGLPSEHKPLTSDNLNLQLKNAKSYLKKPNNDSNDVRHSYVPLFDERLKARLQPDNRHVNSDLNTLVSSMINSNPRYKCSTFEVNNRNDSDLTNCKSTVTLTSKDTALTNGSKHWKNLSKRVSMHATRPSMATQDESDSNDTDTMNSERNPSIHYKVSPRTDSTSKASSRSFNEEVYNESMSSVFSMLGKKTSTTLLDSKASDQAKNINESRCRRTPSRGSWPQESEINLIMLGGLMIGLFISKILQYLQTYFGWFQVQVLHIRNMFLGHNGSIWEFCNFDDTSRYGLRTKLLLLPVVGTCTLLYALSSVFYNIIRCLRAQAPNSIVVFIQKLYLDA